MLNEFDRKTEGAKWKGENLQFAIGALVIILILVLYFKFGYGN